MAPDEPSDKASKLPEIQNEELEPETAPTPAPTRIRPSRRRLAGFVQQVIRSERLFVGPLPPPEDLQKYNDIFPGCGERIVSMAEDQARHRRDLERMDLQASISLASRGQLIAGALALVALCGGIYLVANDKSAEGFALILVDVIALGGAFVYERYRQAQTDQKAPSGRPTQDLEASPFESPASDKVS